MKSIVIVPAILLGVLSSIILTLKGVNQSWIHMLLGAGMATLAVVVDEYLKE